MINIPKFSIIVPIYNSEKYIEACINSLLNQTFNDIEIILVNDGSTDESRLICEEKFKDKKIILLDKQNGGVSSARNYGVKHAQGEYIIFVDSDDEVSEMMCAEYYKILKIEEYDWIISNVIQKKDEKIVHSFSNFMHENELDKNYFINNLAKIYKSGLLNCPYSKCFKKDKIYSLFNEKISLGEDLLFNLNYFANCNKVYYIDKPLYTYKIINSESLSSKYRTDGFYTLSIVYIETTKLLKTILGKNVNLSTVDEKYVLDCIVMAERIAINDNISFFMKRQLIRENYSIYSPYDILNNFILSNGFKWRLYNFLLKKKLYYLFIIIINVLKVVKKIVY